MSPIIEINHLHGITDTGAIVALQFSGDLVIEKDGGEIYREHFVCTGKIGAPASEIRDARDGNYKIGLRAFAVIAAAMIFFGCGKPEPTPQQDAQTKQIAELIRAELAKTAPSPTPTKSQPIPIPDIDNPWDTPEERQTKAARKGVQFTDEKGEKWAVLSRDDNGPVTEGLPIETTAIHSGDNQPICIREAEGWVVRWKKPDQERPTPTPRPTVPPEQKKQGETEYTAPTATPTAGEPS